jgi:hypothetical protein
MPHGDSAPGHLDFGHIDNNHLDSIHLDGYSDTAHDDAFHDDEGHDDEGHDDDGDRSSHNDIAGNWDRLTELINEFETVLQVFRQDITQAFERRLIQRAEMTTSILSTLTERISGLEKRLNVLERKRKRDR